MKQLRPYQTEGVGILAGGGLNASGLGAGKTLMTVEGVRELRLGRRPRVLVVAPVTTLPQWWDTFVEQFPSLEAKDLIHITGSPQRDPETWRRITRKEDGVFIVGWQTMSGGVPDEIRREASKGRNSNAKKPKVTQAAVRLAISKGLVPPWTRSGVWDLVVMDEVHRAVNADGVPRHVLKLIKATQRLALSHTPGGNRPEGLWTILNLIWPEKYPNFWSWAGEHFRVEEREMYIGGKREVKNHIGPELRPGAVWDDIPAVVRYRTEEVFAQLPPVIERTIQVGMGSEQEEQYLDFLEQSLAWLGDMPIATPLPIGQRIRLRQAALGTLKAEEVIKRELRWVAEEDLEEVQFRTDPELTPRVARKREVPTEDGIRVEYRVSFPYEDVEIGYEEKAVQLKLEAVKDILADLPEGEPLLVWTHSARWARMAEKLLGSQAVSWTASTTAAKRKRIQAGFGSEWRVLIAQLQSLSEGVDWLKNACRCEVICSVVEDEVMNQQAEGRLHRPGQTSPVQRWRIVTEGTIDEAVDLNNLKKRLTMGRLYKDRPERKEAA